MTEQVTGQVGLDEIYADWAEVEVSDTNMADDEVAASERSEFATLVPTRQSKIPPTVMRLRRRSAALSPSIHSSTLWSASVRSPRWTMRRSSATWMR